MAQVAIAQDVIVKINGDEIKVNVQEITITDIFYLSADTTDTLNHKLAKSEVFMIRFANPAMMYQKGRQDARLHYNGNGAMLGSAATVLLAGPVGPIRIGAVRPGARYNKALPAASLQDPNTVKGYEKQAHNRKTGKAALGFGIGSGIGVLYRVMSVLSPGK